MNPHEADGGPAAVKLYNLQKNPPSHGTNHFLCMYSSMSKIAIIESERTGSGSCGRAAAVYSKIPSHGTNRNVYMSTKMFSTKRNEPVGSELQ